MAIITGYDQNNQPVDVDTNDIDAQEALSDALVFVKIELPLSDINIYYHEDDDSRKVSLEATWRTYRKDLRNYVQGSTVGTKPTRPT